MKIVRKDVAVAWKKGPNIVLSVRQTTGENGVSLLDTTYQTFGRSYVTAPSWNEAVSRGREVLAAEGIVPDSGECGYRWEVYGFDNGMQQAVWTEQNGFHWRVEHGLTFEGSAPSWDGAIQDSLAVITSLRTFLASFTQRFQCGTHYEAPGR